MTRTTLIIFAGIANLLSETTGSTAAPISTRDARPVVAHFTEPLDDHRGPDGFYGSITDMVQSIEGTPCDESCKTDSYRRWNPSVKSSLERD